MAVKSTLPLAALCCTLALTCPRPATAQAVSVNSVKTPSLAAAVLPSDGVRISCTGCLARSPLANAVVVDTACADGNGKAPLAGGATLRLPGYALDAVGNRLDLELSLDARADGLKDGDIVIDARDAGTTGLLLGNPKADEQAAFSVTTRLLQADTGLPAQNARALTVKRVSSSRAHAAADEDAPSHQREQGGSAPVTFSWSGGAVYRISAEAASTDGASSERDATAPDGAEADGGPSSEDGSPGDDGHGNQTQPVEDTTGRDAAEPGDEPDGAPASSTESAAPTGAPSGTVADTPGPDPFAIAAEDLDPERSCCEALVALDAPQAFVAADYPVTSASSRKPTLLALPRKFPLTYLPSGEVIAPTVLRLMGARYAWIDITGISVENRATDAKIHLFARDGAGNLVEWYDGDSYLKGRYRIEVDDDLDFTVTLEGLSHESDGELIEASVYGAQTLFDLVFEYEPTAAT